jgi:hypothetical protein
MKPSEVSNILRRIASKIDNSENPKRALVAKDLRRVIVAINETNIDIEEMAENAPDVKRADAAASAASNWHQGSGVHADACAGMALYHQEQALAGGPEAAKHQEAAKLWADAAEAEASYLQENQGEWVSGSEDDPEGVDVNAALDRWNQSSSGQATEKAKAVSKLLSLDSSNLPYNY